MSNILLGLFLILFGITMLIETKIPSWVVGLTALATGLVVLVGGGNWWKKGP